jgi:hypothetical protein
MATFKFSYSEPQYCCVDSEDVNVKVEYSISGELALDTLLEHFEEFLKGAGYSASLVNSSIILAERADISGI